MSDLDFKHVKRVVAEINSIVETCPEPLREKCFELLFEAALGRAQEVKIAPSNADDPKGQKSAPQEDASANRSPSEERKLPGNVLAFTRRHGISQQDIDKLFMLDHEPLLPVYKINSSNAAKAQLQKVLMVLLENALLNNQFKAPYSEVRDSCKEDGLYDSNFNKTLKRHHQLFKGAIYDKEIKEDETMELTGAGNDKLTEIIKELGQHQSAA